MGGGLRGFAAAPRQKNSTLSSCIEATNAPSEADEAMAAEGSPSEGSRPSWCSCLPDAATVYYCNAFGCVGLSLALLGCASASAMPLEEPTLETLARLAVARGFGLLGGGCVAAGAFEQWPTWGNQLIALGLVLAAACNASLPFATEVGAELNLQTVHCLYTIFVIQGVVIGLVESGCSLLLTRRHTKHVGPYLQAMHCVLMAGCAAAPLLASADADTEEGNVAWLCGATGYLALSALPGLCLGGPMTVGADGAAKALTELPQPKQSTNLLEHPTRRAVGCEQVAGGGGGSGHRHRYESAAFAGRKCCQIGTENSGCVLVRDRMEGGGEQMRDVNEFYTLLVIGAFVGVYSALESNYATFLLTYATGAGMSEADGLELLVYFFGFMVGGRFLAVPLSMALSPAVMLGLDLVGCTGAAVAMSYAPTDTDVLFIANIVFAIGLSSAWLCSMVLASKYTTVNRSALSILNLWAFAGETLSPILLMWQVDGDAGALSSCMTTAAATALVLFVIIRAVGSSTATFKAHYQVLESDSEAVTQAEEEPEPAKEAKAEEKKELTFML